MNGCFVPTATGPNSPKPVIHSPVVQEVTAQIVLLRSRTQKLVAYVYLFGFDSGGLHHARPFIEVSTDRRGKPISIHPKRLQAGTGELLAHIVFVEHPLQRVADFIEYHRRRANRSEYTVPVRDDHVWQSLHRE